MHILIIPSWYPDTESEIQGSFFREHAIALRRRGHKVGVIALQFHLLQQPSKLLFVRGHIAASIDSGVCTYRKSLVKWFPIFPVAHAAYCRKHGLQMFVQYCAEHGMPDIVHVQSMINAGVIAEALNKKYGLPYLVAEHSSFFRHKIKPARLNVMRNVARRAARRLAVSSSFAALLKNSFGELTGDWDVMPNLVNESFLSFPLCDEKSSGFTFITISFLNNNKRIDLLIRSFFSAFGDNPGVRLVIGGNGERKSSLEHLARSLGDAERVTFLGELTRVQVLRHVSKASAFVLSSDFETFGVALVEALALGKPVIATRSGGPEDIVRDEDGILVPAGDQKAMAKAMIAIYENRSCYNSSIIREGCRERFGESAVMSRLEAVYEEINISSVLERSAVQ